MAFLSEILGRTVTDLDGNYVSKLEDLIARERMEFTHPVVDGLVIDRRGEKQIVPYSIVMSLFAPAIPLKCHVEDVPTYEMKEADIYLSRDVLLHRLLRDDAARDIGECDVKQVSARLRQRDHTG